MKKGIKKITAAAALTAVICALSPWTIPVGPVPISLASLGVYIAASAADWKTGAVSVISYVVIGAIGLPVFSGGGGGFGKLAGPTGGYIIGYVFCALIVGVLADISDGRAAAKLIYPLSLVAGTVALYSFGTLWYMLQTPVSLSSALLVCVAPFLAGDAVKIALAAFVCPQLRRTLAKTVFGEKTAPRKRGGEFSDDDER